MSLQSCYEPSLFRYEHSLFSNENSFSRYENSLFWNENSFSKYENSLLGYENSLFRTENSLSKYENSVKNAQIWGKMTEFGGKIAVWLSAVRILGGFWLGVSVFFFVLVFTPRGYTANYYEGQNND